MMLTVHSQVTFFAPKLRNSVTMCRQAATNAAGAVWVLPQEYHEPFIS